MQSINSFYVIFSIASFITTWVATALLLRHYSLRLGKLKYWIVVSLPLVYFLLQFVAFILHSYVSFLSNNPISYNILITLLFTLSEPVGRHFIWNCFLGHGKKHTITECCEGLSDYFWIWASPAISFGSSIDVNCNSLPTIRTCYDINYWLVMLFDSCRNLFFCNFCTADSDMRRSIRDLAMHDSKLLDSIGTAQMENEIQTKVADVSETKPGGYR